MDGELTDEVPMAGGEEPLGLLETIKERFKRAQDHSANWRKIAREDYDFVAGEQWDDEDKQLLREQLRPVITFNRTGPIVEAVAGSEINNRQEAQYIPRTLDDAGVNEVLTEAARWVRDLCDAEDEESDAFMDTLTCGMGWTETRMDYEEDLDGEIKIDRVDPLEMWWDPDAKKRNLSDIRWVMRVKRITKEDLEAMWPGKADEVIQSGPWDKATDEATGFEANANSPDEYMETDYEEWDNTPDKKKLRVVEYQWWERESVYRVAAGDQVVEFDKERFDRLKDRFDIEGIKYLKQTKRVYKRAFVAGSVILEEGPGPCETDFTFTSITGKRDRNKNTWYGLVRAMRDPQKWANKFYSQILHVINSNAKGGIVAEKDAFENVRDVEKKWARSDSIIWAKPGAVRHGAFAPKPTVPYPTGLDRLMEFAVDAHYTVTGVNLEMLGMADRNQPGVLEYQRKQAGLTILAVLFNSLRRYRKSQGRVMLYFIREYISDGRLIRITGPEGAKYIQLLKNDDTIKYDVIVDEAATSPNQKERVFQIMTQILPMIMKTGVPIPPEILDYAPLPQSLVTKWKQQIQQGGDDEQLKQQVQQLTEENARLKMSQETKVMQAQMKDQLDQKKFQADVEETKAELGLEEYRTERELELEERKVEGELAIKRKATSGDN